MKFTGLTSSQRSMLTHLAACGTGVTTDLLGRGCVPKLQPQNAASVLLDMRKKGLVYAHQKTSNQDYCNWMISEYGSDVFMSRPDEVPAPKQPATDYVESKPAQRLRLWLIVPGMVQYQGTDEDVAGQLSRMAEAKPGTMYTAYVAHSEATLPVPKAQIALL